VLFVHDEPGAWTRYRCDHQAEQLGFVGVTSDVVQSDRIDLTAAVDHYETFVLNRVGWRDSIAAFLDHARTRRRVVVFDTDDLIFEPDLIGHFAVFENWPEEERRKEVEKLERYQLTLRACDAATVATEPLVDHARRHLAHVDLVPNVVSDEMVRLADLAVESRFGRDDGVVIAYLSGTRTHNRDFLEAAGAVLWALDSYSETRFVAVGKLDLDERFDRFAHRIERIPIRPWQELPQILAGIDINLAPLERHNPFTECKSCVKYLEAGLLGVPTIASPRADFVRVIENRRNGLLADDPDEWRQAVALLIDDADRRGEIGEAAAADVRRHHTTRARARPGATILTRPAASQ
jgi:glycosyltransferase involved in cell wall biosynthesis